MGVWSSGELWPAFAGDAFLTRKVIGSDPIPTARGQGACPAAVSGDGGGELLDGRCHRRIVPGGCLRVDAGQLVPRQHTPARAAPIEPGVVRGLAVAAPNEGWK